MTSRLVDWVGEIGVDGPKEQAPGDYPFVATRHGIEGRVRVAYEVDAQGRVLSSRIASRELHVPGVSGRPVCFERLLDEASLVRAAGRPTVPPPPGALVNGRAREGVDIKWRLE